MNLCQMTDAEKGRNQGDNTGTSLVSFVTYLIALLQAASDVLVLSLQKKKRKNYTEVVKDC